MDTPPPSTRAPPLCFLLAPNSSSSGRRDALHDPQIKAVLVLHSPQRTERGHRGQLVVVVKAAPKAVPHSLQMSLTGSKNHKM